MVEQPGKAQNLNIHGISIDGVRGIRTWNRKMVGKDDTTEL